MCKSKKVCVPKERNPGSAWSFEKESLQQFIKGPRRSRPARLRYNGGKYVILLHTFHLRMTEVTVKEAPRGENGVQGSLGLRFPWQAIVRQRNHVRGKRKFSTIYRGATMKVHFRCWHNASRISWSIWIQSSFLLTSMKLENIGEGHKLV